MKRIIITLITVIIAAGNISAQEETPSESILDRASHSFTLGYESRYVLYGYRSSRHLWHADIFSYLPVSDRVSVWAGAWYGYLPDGTYHELDGYVGLDFWVNSYLSAGVGYSIFNYMEVPFPTSDQAHEFMGRVTLTKGPVSLTLKEQYDTEAQGHLLRAIGEFSYPLCEAVSLTAAAEYGYAVEYFIEDDAANHALYTLKLPVQLTDTLSAQPFISHSEPLEAIDSFEENETYGGLFVTVGF